MKDIIEYLKIDNWNNVFSSKEFWYEYFDAEEDYQGYFFRYFNIDEDTYWDGDKIYVIVLELSLPQNYKFRLDFSINTAYDTDLTLILPDGITNPSNSENPNELDIGWDDRAHWHPDVFRWEELEAIMQCLEKTQKEQLGFDLKFVPLLLRKFTPATKANAEFVFEQTRRYFRETGLFSENEIEELVEMRDYFPEDFSWVYDEERGWIAKGEDGYSLRHYDPDWESDDNFFGIFRNFMRMVYREAGVEEAV
jgi:hypothetical protein